MRTAIGALAGMALAGLIYGVTLASMLTIVDPPDAEAMAASQEEVPGFLAWAVLLGIFLAGALAGGLLAGFIAREGRLLAAGLVGTFVALQVIAVPTDFELGLLASIAAALATLALSILAGRVTQRWQPEPTS